MGISKYQDRFGLIHHKEVENGDPETSENGLVFSVVYLVSQWMKGIPLDKSVISGIMACYDDRAGVWKPTPISSPDSHLSHDNCTAIDCFRYLVEGKAFLPFPVQRAKPGSPTIIHPRDAIIRSGVKKDFGWKYWGKPLIKCMVSLDDPTKNSSGPQMWFLRVHLLYFAEAIDRKTLTDWLFSDPVGSKPYWILVFWTYYLKNNQHPTVILWVQ